MKGCNALLISLKEAMSACSVLALSNFTQPFILECDAFGEGIGVVLMQDRHPIAYESRKITKAEHLYSIYDRDVGHRACTNQIPTVSSR